MADHRHSALIRRCSRATGSTMVGVALLTWRASRGSLRCRRTSAEMSAVPTSDCSSSLRSHATILRRDWCLIAIGITLADAAGQPRP